MQGMIKLSLIAVLVVLAGFTRAAAAADCQPVDGIVSICGLRAPEDIVAAPDGRHLLFGEMVAEGSLKLLDTRSLAVSQLFPAPGVVQEEGLNWGDPACTAPASINAHGLDIHRRRDGHWQLFVVNHAGRESIELFELLESPGQAPSLAWRGCALAPGQVAFNDVAGFADGSFLATHMADHDAGLGTVLRVLVFGADSGEVYRWRSGEGFRAVPGTSGQYPNGITLSPDERYFYLNEYFPGLVHKHDARSGERLGSVAVNMPDNSTYSPGGRLLVASHQVGLLDLFESLQQEHDQPSLLPFDVVAVDPETLQSEVVLSRDGPPMGAGTVALQHGDFLYIGSYVGDRIIRVPLPAGL